MRLAPLFPLIASLIGWFVPAAEAQVAQLQPADAALARQAQQQGFTGRGLTVVVIDPGGFATSSPALRASLVGEACFNTDGNMTFCPNGQASMIGGGASDAPWPASTRGTVMAEAISSSNPAAMGVAPGAQIYAIHIGGPADTGDPVATRVALQHVYYTVRTQLAVAAVVLPMVLNGDESSANLCADADFRYIVNALRDANIPTVLPAGDGGLTGGLQFNQCRLESFTVSALNQDNTVSPTSDVSQDIAFGVIAGPNLVTAAGDGTIKTVPNSSAWAAAMAAGGFAVMKQYRMNASVNAIEAAMQAGGLTIAINDPTPGSREPLYHNRRLDVSNAMSFLQADWIPETGFWWNPAAPGTGYFLDVQGNAMYFGAFAYNDAGQPVWYVGRINQSGPTSFSGTLNVYGGGPQQGSPAYVPPASLGSAATVQLSFPTEDDIGVLQIQTASGTTTVPIERYRNFYNAYANSGFNAQRPQTGWYWDPSQPGSGYAIELLGDNMFMVSFSYDAGGNAQWTLSTGTTLSSQFYVQARPVLYINGQTLIGPYSAPAVSSQLTNTQVRTLTPHTMTVMYETGVVVNNLKFRFLDP